MCVTGKEKSVADTLILVENAVIFLKFMLSSSPRITLERGADADVVIRVSVRATCVITKRECSGGHLDGLRIRMLRVREL